MLLTVAPIEKDALLPYLHAVARRRDLPAADAGEAMRTVLRGEVSDAQIAAFLLALHMKGETAEELAGFARAIRESALPFPFSLLEGERLLDTCGTGGDGHNTFNISTTTAFVVAACGVLVAKHGNRSVSSNAGSADVLECLGIPVVCSAERAAYALREAGICFLFAPAFHPKLKQVGSVRRELKMRTVFNLLGPLSNPAYPSFQIVGVPSLDAAGRMASALAELGLERGYVIHGDDGLDEVSLSGLTTGFAIVSGTVTPIVLEPRDFGLQSASLEAIRGGTPEVNARITLDVLKGRTGPPRDIVLANAALALLAAQRAETLHDAVQQAAHAIDSGAARDKLEQLKNKASSPPESAGRETSP